MLSHPRSSRMCNIAPLKPGLRVSILHIPPNFKSNLVHILLYLVQSASTLLLFSQTHKRAYLQECKHFKQLDAISSVPPEVKKETWQYWRKTTSGNKVKQPHNVTLSHWINKQSKYLFIFQHSNFFPPLLLMFLATIALLNHGNLLWFYPWFYE